MTTAAALKRPYDVNLLLYARETNERRTSFSLSLSLSRAVSEAIHSENVKAETRPLIFFN